MPADIGDLAALDDEDRVGVDKRGQPMRNDDDRAPVGDRRRFWRMIASLSGSSALVASSKISSCGLVMSARAMARRCLCPPERLEAFSSSIVSKPRGRRSMNSSAPAMRAAVGDLLEGRVGLRRGDVLAHRAAKQEAVLQHDADALAQMRRGRSRGCQAVDAHEPLLDRVEALDQPGHRRLARAARPTMPKTLPAGTVKEMSSSAGAPSGP